MSLINANCGKMGFELINSLSLGESLKGHKD